MANWYLSDKVWLELPHFCGYLHQLGLSGNVQFLQNAYSGSVLIVSIRRRSMRTERVAVSEVWS
jgi:hypothetical protein